MGVVEFLSARLDEDERVAREVDADAWGLDQDGGAYYEWQDLPPSAYSHARRHGPARVLADVAAKRAILAWAVAHPRSCGNEHPRFDVYHPDGHGPHEIATLLAQPFADHPDFDPAWKVET